MIFIFLTCGSLFAQIDGNYWNNEYGAKGQLLNGSVIANINDNSAVYYNPAAIGIDSLRNEKVSFAVLTPRFRTINTNSLQLKNAKNTSFSILPNMVAFSFPSSSNKYNIVATIFSRNKTNVRFQSDYSQDAPNDEIFKGSVNYQNARKEIWIGVGFSRHLTKNLRIGLSQFSVTTSHFQSRDIESKMLSSFSDSNPNQYYRSFDKFDFGVGIGWLTKIGLQLELNKLKVGFTLTSPQYLKSLKSASYQVSESEMLTGNELKQKSILNPRRKYNEYKTPFSFAFGLSYPVRKHHTFNFSTEVFSKVDEYQIIKDITTGYQLTDASKSVTNFAIGYEAKLSSAISLLTSFKTNFNHSQNIKLDQDNEQKIKKFDWNIYHFALGGHFKIRSFAFSIGAEYAFSDKSNDNLFNPYNTSANKFGFNGIARTTDAGRYNSFSIYLNYAILFDSILSMTKKD